MAIENRVYDAVYSRLKLIPSWDDKQRQLIASLAVAQTKHETYANGSPYSSNVYKSLNNVAGYMFYAGSEWQQKKPSGITVKDGTYAKYDSVENSAKELGDWIKRRSIQFTGVTTVDKYAQVLKSNGYYTDSESNYAGGMKRFFKSITPSLGNGLMVVLPLAVLGLAALFWFSRKSY